MRAARCFATAARFASTCWRPGSSRLAASNSASAASRLESSYSATPAKLSSVGSRGSLSSALRAPAATFASRGILRARETLAPAASPPSRRSRVAHRRRWGSSIAGSSDSSLPYPARSPELQQLLGAGGQHERHAAALPSALGFEGEPPSTRLVIDRVLRYLSDAGVSVARAAAS